MIDYIIIFKIEKALKYLSHLELMRLFRQIFIRIDLPIVFSKGFSPHMKISFARAKSVGLESQGELIEIKLKNKIKEGKILNCINNNMPEGIKVLKIIKKNKTNKSISSLIKKAEYKLSLFLENNDNKKKIIKNIIKYFNKKEIFVEIFNKKCLFKKNCKEDILDWKIINTKKNLYIKIVGNCNNEKTLKIEAIVKNLLKNINFYGKYNLKRISFLIF